MSNTNTLDLPTVRVSIGQWEQVKVAQYPVTSAFTYTLDDKELLISFDMMHPDFDVDQPIEVRGFKIGRCQAWVAGYRSSLPDPLILFDSAQHMLDHYYPNEAGKWSHSNTDLLEQVSGVVVVPSSGDAGVVGGGMVIVDTRTQTISKPPKLYSRGVYKVSLAESAEVLRYELETWIRMMGFTEVGENLN